MRLPGSFLLFLLLHCALSLPAQVPDTVITLTDSVRIATRDSVKKEFQRWKDSVEADRMKKYVQKNGQPLNQFLQERHEEEKAAQRRRWIRIGAGAFLLFALFFAIARRSGIGKNRKG